jgi:hypothetical protein
VFFNCSFDNKLFKPIFLTLIKTSWYRELCLKSDDPEWQPTPSLITTRTRVTPNLLRLTWKGYPMHHHEKLGWGFLMSGEELGKRKFSYS